MVEIYHRIKKFADVPRLSKHEQIVNGIITSIEDGVVERGELLPSINQLSQELSFARKTIDRAYGDLKARGLVESRNRRGFFVHTESVEQTIRVALVMYEFRPFQEVFYNSFRESLGENVQVDTFFHHNNLEVFKDIVTKINGRYGMYVVAPIINKKSKSILSILATNRLLLVDRLLDPKMGSAQVTQEFEQSTLSILNDLKDRIGNYQQVVLFFRKDEDYPIGILNAFQQFCGEEKISLSVRDRYKTGSLEKDVLYVTVGDSDLWTLVEDCIDQEWVMGKDLGVLSHNESRIKKMVYGGVSTWSTDFRAMAELSAKFVLERIPLRETIPTVFIDRGSL